MYQVSPETAYIETLLSLMPIRLWKITLDQTEDRIMWSTMIQIQVKSVTKSLLRVMQTIAPGHVARPGHCMDIPCAIATPKTRNIWILPKKLLILSSHTPIIQKTVFLIGTLMHPIFLMKS